MAEALVGAELAAVVVPCGARERWVRAIAPHTTPDDTVLPVGEGGGASWPSGPLSSHALVSGSGTRLGRDLTGGPPTLAALGLGGLDVTGLIGFARSGRFP